MPRKEHIPYTEPVSTCKSNKRVESNRIGKAKLTDGNAFQMMKEEATFEAIERSGTVMVS